MTRADKTMVKTIADNANVYLDVQVDYLTQEVAELKTVLIRLMSFLTEKELKQNAEYNNK